MKIRKTHIVILGIMLLFPVAGLCFYPFLPDQIAVHWSSGSEPDHYMDTLAGVFLMPLICWAIAVPGLILPYMVIYYVYKSEKIKNWFEIFIIIMNVFVLVMYLGVLLWNAGYKINIPVLAWGSIAALNVVIVGSIFRVHGKKKHDPIGIEKTRRVPLSTEGIYSDRLVEINNDEIIFQQYSIFGKSKTVKLSEVESIEVKQPTLRSGKWRIHGTSDFKTWFPLDDDRPSRDKIFIMKVRGKWMQIGFTVEDSQTVLDLFKTKGFIK